jgi:hypothetical protein
LQSIADFMSINIDVDIQDIQTNVGNWYRNSHILNGESTTLVLYDLIKKRCNFSKFIALLSQDSTGS